MQTRQQLQQCRGFLTEGREELVEAACRDMQGLRKLLTIYANEPAALDAAESIVRRAGWSDAQARSNNLAKECRSDRKARWSNLAHELHQKFLVKLLRRQRPLRLRTETYEAFHKFCYAGMQSKMKDLT